MRVLHIMTRFIRGGAEEKVLLELGHLRDEHEFTLATGRETDPRVTAPLEGWGIPRLEVKNLRHYAPFSAGAAIREMRRLIRKQQPDVVHTHSTEAGLLGREAAHRERVPKIIHTIHGHEFSPAHPWPIRKTVVAFHRHLARFTSRYLSNADALTREFLEAGIGGPEQFVTVRSGFAVGDVESAPPVPLEGEPLILTAARLAKGKGLEELIDATAMLVPRWPTLRLAIAGAGPLQSGLERQAHRRGITGRVDFLGFRTDLPGLMKRADVFAFASHREGTPRAVTLAMAAGCPVVATDIDGIPEQVDAGRTGLLVPARDSRSLADAIESTLRDPTAARARAEQGKEKAAEFSLERMLAATRRVYESIA